MKIAICTSARFYPQAIPVADQLEILGINPLLPHTAEKMRQNQSTNEETIIEWDKTPDGYVVKAGL